MAWVAVDKRSIEYVFLQKPVRLSFDDIGDLGTWQLPEEFVNSDYGVYWTRLPQGTIESILRKPMTWCDEPFELVVDFKL